MKVSRRTDPRLPLQGNLGQADATTRREGGAQNPKSGVSISPQARMLQQALQAKEPFDAQKVEQLKKLMAQGDYRVDVPRLAEKLADEILKGS